MAIRRWRTHERRHGTAPPTTELRVRELAGGLRRRYPTTSSPDRVTWTGRVGVTAAADRPWRALVAGDPNVSPGRPGPARRRAAGT